MAKPQRHETKPIIETRENSRRRAAKRFAELAGQGQPVLVGSEIATMMSNEGFDVYDVAEAILDMSNDSPYNFAVSIVSDGSEGKPPSLYVSDTQLDPKQQFDVLYRPYKYMKLVVWPALTNR